MSREDKTVKNLIGQRLFQAGMITENHIQNILTRKKCGDKRTFGEIAVSLKYIKQKALDNFFYNI